MPRLVVGMKVSRSEICDHEVFTLSRSIRSVRDRVVVYHTGGGETARVLADPENEKRAVFEALTSEGYRVVSITSSNDHWGSPRSLRAHNILYERIASGRGHGRVAVFCQSMGGLSAYSWTCRCPERVLGIYGIYPVTNLESMLNGKLGDSIEGVYSQQGIDIHNALSKFDPIRQIESANISSIPAKHRHGDQDSLVRYNENAVDFARVYRDRGGSLDLVTIRGLGHEANPAFFNPDDAVDFVNSLDWCQ